MKVTARKQTELGIWAKTIPNQDPDTCVYPQKEYLGITKNPTCKLYLFPGIFLVGFKNSEKEGGRRRRTEQDSGPTQFFSLEEMANFFSSGVIIVCFPTQLVYIAVCL